MTIKEVAEKYGLRESALRYYEKIGAVPPVKKNASGIRDYTADDVAWVNLAVCMRRAGLSMEALSKYVALNQKGARTIPQRLRLLEKQRDDLLEKKKRINDALKLLNHKVKVYEKAVETGVVDWNCDD